MRCFCNATLAALLMLVGFGCAAKRATPGYRGQQNATYDVLAGAILRQCPALKLCYEDKTARKVGDTGGKAVVTFSLQADGTVDAAKTAVESEIDDPTFIDCIKAGFNRIHVPPNQTPLTIHYPLIFKDQLMTKDNDATETLTDDERALVAQALFPRVDKLRQCFATILAEGSAMTIVAKATWLQAGGNLTAIELPMWVGEQAMGCARREIGAVELPARAGDKHFHLPFKLEP